MTDTHAPGSREPIDYDFHRARARNLRQEAMASLPWTLPVYWAAGNLVRLTRRAAALVMPGPDSARLEARRG